MVGERTTGSHFSTRRINQVAGYLKGIRRNQSNLNVAATYRFGVPQCLYTRGQDCRGRARPSTISKVVP